MKSRPAVQCLALVVFVVALSVVEHAPMNTTMRRSLEARPIMYTFLETEFPEGLPKRTGMTEEEDEELLDKWKLYWTQAGWDPRVLKLDDAKAHPNYIEFVHALSGLPFGYYDRLCFLRWLAMAHVGGGWMSDYDTFPLEDFTKDASSLPNDGRFTTYENNVPSLVSASGLEYLRLALLMADNANRHKNETHWSDMKALGDLHKTSGGTAFEVRREVLGGILALNGIRVWKEEQCVDSAGQRAVHFSHHSMDKGITVIDAHAKDRPAIASEWLDMWKTSCGSDSTTPELLTPQEPEANSGGAEKSIEEPNDSPETE